MPISWILNATLFHWMWVGRISVRGRRYGPFRRPPGPADRLRTPKTRLFHSSDLSTGSALLRVLRRLFQAERQRSNTRKPKMKYRFILIHDDDPGITATISGLTLLGVSPVRHCAERYFSRLYRQLQFHAAAGKPCFSRSCRWPIFQPGHCVSLWYNTVLY